MICKGNQYGIGGCFGLIRKQNILVSINNDVLFLIYIYKKHIFIKFYVCNYLFIYLNIYGSKNSKS